MNAPGLPCVLLVPGPMGRARSIRVPKPPSPRSSTILCVALWFGVLPFAWAPAVRAQEPPTLSIDDARIKEGPPGARELDFTVRLSDPVGYQVAVRVATEDGTATAAGGDYLPIDMSFVFEPGAVSDTVAVGVTGDDVIEGNEWFRVRLLEPQGAALADSEAFGIILNDDRTQFVRVVDAVPQYTYGTLPNAWGDYDNDGYPDLPLYQSLGNGRLAEIPGFRALLDRGNYHGPAWCDYDRDGDLDLVLLGYADKEEGGFPTPTRLLRNDGPEGFVDVARLSGMDVVGNGETPSWADFDGDGWPDLFTPYYSHVYPYQSFLYHNTGDGLFIERAAAAGVSLPGLPVGLRPEGAQAADWDDDGHVDLYCAHHLFIHDGTGNFTDVREAVGLPILFDEGAALVDYDNDGDLDLYLRSTVGPRLFNNRSGHFEEVTAAAGLPPVALLWGDSWADAEGDGDLDLLLIPPSDHARLFLNQGDGTFERDSLFDQLQVPGELASWGDCDNDGDMDFVVGAGYTRQVYLSLAAQLLPASQRPLRVHVLDERGCQTAYGATVRLTQIGGPPGSVQTRVVDGGSGYLGQNDYRIYFGGVGSGSYSLQVVYPSPAGTRIVIDSTADVLLGPIQPGVTGDHAYAVYRDGHAAIEAVPILGVGYGGRGIPALGVLGSPVPNPARAAVTVPFGMRGAGRAAGTIVDVHGRRVRSIDLGQVPPGGSSIRWDLEDDRGSVVPDGVYFLRLTVDGRAAGARKILVVR